MPVTFYQAMTQVHNAAIVTFGAFDQGGEFSTMLANFVSGGADGFQGLERSAEDLGINIRSAFSGLSDAFERSDEHPSELQSLMRIPYAVFCLKNTYIMSSYVYTRLALE